MVDCDSATQQLCSLQSEVKQSQERDHEEQMRIQSQLHTLSSQLNEKEVRVDIGFETTIVLVHLGDISLMDARQVMCVFPADES